MVEHFKRTIDWRLKNKMNNGNMDLIILNRNRLPDLTVTISNESIIIFREQFLICFSVLHRFQILKALEIRPILIAAK